MNFLAETILLFKRVVHCLNYTDITVEELVLMFMGCGQDMSLYEKDRHFPSAGRRKPATYQRIIKNIVGHSITVHCTVTHQMVNRVGYFEEFLSFWSDKPEVKKVWFSLFTPQMGAQAEEILSQDERAQVLAELTRLRTHFPKLHLPQTVIDGYHKPRNRLTNVSLPEPH